MAWLCSVAKQLNRTFYARAYTGNQLAKDGTPHECQQQNR